MTRFAARLMGYSDNGQSLIILDSRRPFTKSVVVNNVYTFIKRIPELTLGEICPIRAIGSILSFNGESANQESPRL